MGDHWKNVERRVAKRIGGERVPVTGRARGSAPDVAHGYFAVEVKYRKALPQWLWKAVEQAVRAAREDQLPLVILHERGRHMGDDLVVMRMDEFEVWCRYYQRPLPIYDVDESESQEGDVSP